MCYKHQRCFRVLFSGARASPPSSEESEKTQELGWWKQPHKCCRVKSWRRRDERHCFLLWWHLCNAGYIYPHKKGCDRFVPTLSFDSDSPHSMTPLKLLPVSAWRAVGLPLLLLFPMKHFEVGHLQSSSEAWLSWKALLPWKTPSRAAMLLSPSQPTSGAASRGYLWVACIRGECRGLTCWGCLSAGIPHAQKAGFSCTFLWDHCIWHIVG